MSDLSLTDVRSALHAFMPAAVFEVERVPDLDLTRMRLSADVVAVVELSDQVMVRDPERAIEQAALAYQQRIIRGFGIQPIIDSAAQPEISKRTALIAKLEADVERIGDEVRQEGADLEPVERARQRGRQAALRDVIAQLKAL